MFSRTLFLSVFLSYTLCIHQVWPVLAETTDKQKLSQFFGVAPQSIHVECPQNSFQFHTSEHSEELSICLNKASKRKRCEIAIHPFSKAPYSTHISYEMKLSHNVAQTDQWISILQIHSFPDASEKWRCPPVSMEAYKGTLRLFNRWDKNPISKTDGINCAAKNSSIQNRIVFDNLPYSQGHWYPVSIATTLTHYEHGQFDVSIDGHEKHTYEGPTSYNDRRSPYLKFGLYKPNGWHGKHIISCITYRNVDISLKKQ